MERFLLTLLGYGSDLLREHLIKQLIRNLPLPLDPSVLHPTPFLCRLCQHLTLAASSLPLELSASKTLQELWDSPGEFVFSLFSSRKTNR